MKCQHWFSSVARCKADGLVELLSPSGDSQGVLCHAHARFYKSRAAEVGEMWTEQPFVEGKKITKEVDDE